MTPNYRGWLWSLAAVAGTATAAVVVYKLATRGLRRHAETDAHAAAEAQAVEDADHEWLSEDEADEAEEAEAEQPSELALDRGRNMMMAMLGLMLMVLVTVVSLVLTWNSEDDENSFVELPMFQPLMWIAVGIFSGGVTGFYEGRSNQERSSSGSDKAYLQK